MDTTIRNLDADAYRRLEARAARTGKTVGEALSEAIRLYLAGPESLERTMSLRALRPRAYPAGNERLSEEVDAVVFGR